MVTTAVWHAEPPTLDDVRSGRIHWWVRPPNGNAWPVELFTRGDMVIEAKSGLPIERRQLQGARWAMCVPPAEPTHRVLAQIIRAPSADLTGIRVIVDGEVIGTGDYGGEPEDNCEYRDYKWVKELLVTLARKLGADAEIESVEVDGPTERAASEAYYTAMAAKPDGAR